MSTEALLAERGKTHGEFAEHAACTQEIMDVLRKYRNWDILHPMQRETLHMVAHKIGRIMTGNPDVADHYDDMAGYSRLISQRLDVIAKWREGFELRRAEQSRPGTPEDGGHHARQEQEEHTPLVVRELRFDGQLQTWVFVRNGVEYSVRSEDVVVPDGATVGQGAPPCVVHVRRSVWEKIRK